VVRGRVRVRVSSPCPSWCRLNICPRRTTSMSTSTSPRLLFGSDFPHHSSVVVLICAHRACHSGCRLCGAHAPAGCARRVPHLGHSARALCTTQSDGDSPRQQVERRWLLLDRACAAVVVCAACIRVLCMLISSYVFCYGHITQKYFSRRTTPHTLGSGAQFRSRGWSPTA
jgi:hypothetical protein